jgi:hypothetical protein
MEEAVNWVACRFKGWEAGASGVSLQKPERPESAQPIKQKIMVYFIGFLR